MLSISACYSDCHPTGRVEEELTLLDSCSTLSLISLKHTEVIRSTPWGNSCFEEIPDMTVGGIVPNQLTKILGVMTRFVVNGETSIPIRFYVVDKIPAKAQILIGWPDWSTLDITVDSGKVTMGRNRMPFEIIKEETELVSNEDE